MGDTPTLIGSELELIECERQPGELRITKGACIRQYNRARKKTARNGTGPFPYVRWYSLEICRSCPKGRRYARGTATHREQYAAVAAEAS
jgi:hypothetical protein